LPEKTEVKKIFITLLVREPERRKEKNSAGINSQNQKV